VAIAANASCHKLGVPVAVTIPSPVATSKPAVARATPRTSPATGVAKSQRRATAVIGTITSGGSDAATSATVAPIRRPPDRDRLHDLIVGGDAGRDEVRAQERQ
jgi:hypothetical protein